MPYRRMLYQPPEYVNQAQTNQILFAIMKGMKADQADPLRKCVKNSVVVMASVVDSWLFLWLTHCFRVVQDCVHCAVEHAGLCEEQHDSTGSCRRRADGWHSRSPNLVYAPPTG